MDETLRTVLTSARRHRVVVALATLVAVAVSLQAYNDHEATYTAAALLGPSNSSAVSAAVYGQPYARVTTLSPGRLANSREFAERVVARSGEELDPDEVLGRVSIGSTSGSELIEVRYVDGSAERALRVASVITEELLASDQQSRVEMLDTVRASIESMMETRLEEASELRNEWAGADQVPIDQEVDLQRALASYRYLAERLDNLELLSDAGPGIEVWREPYLVGSDAPNRLAFLSLGAIVGLLLGSVGSVGIDRLKRRLDDPAQVSVLIGAPVIGNIPAESDSPQASQHVADAWRLFRARLLHEISGTRPATIMLVPIVACDGMRDVVTSVATHLAASGRRVALISVVTARSAELSDRLGVDQGLPGLTEAARRLVAPNQVIHRTDVSGLSLVPSGDVDASGHRLVDSPALTDVVALLRQDTDIILILTDPTDSSVDAVIAAELADGIVLLGALDTITRDSARRCTQLLGDVSADTIGVLTFRCPESGEQEHA